eukprot:scaffold4781_cov339-Prasinococcus_capsulatus_cf.AAC.13
MSRDEAGTWERRRHAEEQRAPGCAVWTTSSRTCSMVDADNATAAAPRQRCVQRRTMWRQCAGREPEQVHSEEQVSEEPLDLRPFMGGPMQVRVRRPVAQGVGAARARLRRADGGRRAHVTLAGRGRAGAGAARVEPGDDAGHGAGRRAGERAAGARHGAQHDAPVRGALQLLDGPRAMREAACQPSRGPLQQLRLGGPPGLTAAGAGALAGRARGGARAPAAAERARAGAAKRARRSRGAVQRAARAARRAAATAAAAAAPARLRRRRGGVQGLRAELRGGLTTKEGRKEGDRLPRAASPSRGRRIRGRVRSLAVAACRRRRCRTTSAKAGRGRRRARAVSQASDIHTHRMHSKTSA